jgi:hypothetical protein
LLRGPLTQGCALTIGPLGVSIIHKHRQEVLNNDKPSHIVYAKVMPTFASKDAKEYDCFGYITQNIKLVGRHTPHSRPHLCPPHRTPCCSLGGLPAL